MHKCLQLERIQAEIFAHALQPEWHWPVEPCWDRRSVANLALTCRGFYENAMDTLWSHIDDLRPLIMVMSPEIWSTTTFSSYGHQNPHNVVFVVSVIYQSKTSSCQGC